MLFVPSVFWVTLLFFSIYFIGHFILFFFFLNKNVHACNFNMTTFNINNEIILLKVNKIFWLTCNIKPHFNIRSFRRIRRMIGFASNEVSISGAICLDIANTPGGPRSWVINLRGIYLRPRGSQLRVPQIPARTPTLSLSNPHSRCFSTKSVQYIHIYIYK